MTAQRSRTGVGIIGCGNISNVYAAKLSALPFIDLVACADVLPDPAKELAERHGIPKVLEPDRLIADDDVEVVVNLTIPAAHYPVSRRVVDSGKSVFCEKPLALTLDEGLELGRAAKEMGVRVGCAPDTFLGGGLQTCRKLIDDGAIGEPVAASGFMLSPGPESWHPGPAAFYQRGAGPLFDMGPYYLTALVHLLGPVRRITGSARITHAQREIGSQPLRGQTMDVEVPTHVSAVLDFASGPVANLTTSFDVQTTRLRNIEIYGSEATLSVPDPNTFGGPVTIRKSGEQAWTEMPLTHRNAEQSRGIGLADMICGVQEKRPHRASLELSSHVLDLMESIVAASDAGRHAQPRTTCERPAPLPAGLPDDTFDA
ncbi:MAG: Gfo/Idh/MocA family oxidoreductase [Myxococcota bacterium]